MVIRRMTEVENIVKFLLETDEDEDQDIVKDVAGYRANVSLDRLQRLPVQQEGEDDDEETIKDILGADYLEPPEPAVHGEVERFGRWADIRIGNNSFCV